MKQRVFDLNPRMRIFEISAKTGDGIETWASWLKQAIRDFAGAEHGSV